MTALSATVITTAPAHPGNALSPSSSAASALSPSSSSSSSPSAATLSPPLSAVVTATAALSPSPPSTQQAPSNSNNNSPKNGSNSSNPIPSSTTNGNRVTPSPSLSLPLSIPLSLPSSVSNASGGNLMAMTPSLAASMSMMITPKFEVPPIDTSLLPTELPCVPGLSDEDNLRVHALAAEGNPMAAWRCGTTHDITRLPPATQCVPWLVKAIEAGSILACGELGILKITGQHGVDVDVATGNALLARAYEGGCLHSQLMAGVMAWANNRHDEARRRWLLILEKFGDNCDDTIITERLMRVWKLPSREQMSASPVLRAQYSWHVDIVEWMGEASRRTGRLARYLLSTLYAPTCHGPAPSAEAAYESLQRYAGAKFNDALLRVTAKSDLATITPTLIDVAAAGLVCATYGQPSEKRLRLELANVKQAATCEIHRLRDTRVYQDKKTTSMLIKAQQDAVTAVDELKRYRQQYDRHVSSLTGALEAMQSSQQRLIAEVRHWKKKAEDAIQATAAITRYIGRGQGATNISSLSVVDQANANAAHAAFAIQAAAALAATHSTSNSSTNSSNATPTVAAALVAAGIGSGITGSNHSNTNNNNGPVPVDETDDSGDDHELPPLELPTQSSLSELVAATTEKAAAAAASASSSGRTQKPYGACLACYTMKMKCDGHRPCERCRHNGRAAQCLDRPRKKPLARRTHVNAVLAAATPSSSSSTSGVPPIPVASSSSSSSTSYASLAIAVPSSSTMATVQQISPPSSSYTPSSSSSSSTSTFAQALDAATHHTAPTRAHVATAITAPSVTARASPDRPPVTTNTNSHTNGHSNNSGSGSGGSRRIAQGGACSICHAHKTKCSGGRPCDRCRRMNRADQCRDRNTAAPVITKAEANSRHASSSASSSSSNVSPPSQTHTLDANHLLAGAKARRRSRSSSPMPAITNITRGQSVSPPNPAADRERDRHTSDDDDDTIDTAPPLVSASEAAAVTNATAPTAATVVTATPAIGRSSSAFTAPSSHHAATALSVLATAARVPQIPMAMPMAMNHLPMAMPIPSIPYSAAAAAAAMLSGASITSLLSHAAAAPPSSSSSSSSLSSSLSSSSVGTPSTSSLPIMATATATPSAQSSSPSTASTSTATPAIVADAATSDLTRHSPLPPPRITMATPVATSILL